MSNKNRLTIILFSIFFSACQNNTKELNYLPSEDANYMGENIEFQLPCGDKIAGTFTHPKNPVKKLPAVVLITGSSAHDRDNSRPDKPLNSYRPFRQLAEKLSTNGLAVLRLDDRGVGKSTGGHIDNLTTPERADDIREGIQYLKSRNEIDSLRIGLIGLSEGASIAHMISSKDKSIKCLVLLSGIGSTGKEIIEYQIKNGLLNRNDLPKLLKQNKNLEFLYQFDPLKTASLIQTPVLIINGKTDKSVPYTDAFKLKNAIRANGNNNVEVNILPNHNHLLLKESSDGICGHNIIDHDKVYLEKWAGTDFTRKYKFIDTLFLSPLLFPEHPYHRLIKDDKLDPENLNNPYIDATKARDLFYELMNAFHELDEQLKHIYFNLLKNSEYFRFFFNIIGFSDETNNLEELIFSYFKQLICSSSNIRNYIINDPVALSYTLALIQCKKQESITPPWVLHHFPNVERIMFQLRSEPCLTGCEYCNQSFDARKSLKEYFGFSSFREFGGVPMQEQAVNAALHNESILVIFPTGGG